MEIDPWAWAGLAGDVIDLIPGITGVGEGTKALGASVKSGKYAKKMMDE